MILGKKRWWKWGFNNIGASAKGGLSINQTLMLFGMLFGLLITNFIIFQPDGAGMEKMLLMVTMIVSIYSAAVICAVFPKQKWGFFQFKEAHSYPVSGYVTSGVIAIISSVFISLCFKTLIFVANPKINGVSHAFINAWSNFTTSSYPWVVMSFVTAIITSFLIDWRQPQWIKDKWKRYVEGLIQAVTLMLSAFLVYLWLSDISEKGGWIEGVPELSNVLRATFIIGLFLGLIVPTWYRKSSVSHA